MSGSSTSRSALQALFAPRDIALLGVSRDPAKLGHALLKNVVAGGFAGAVHVVNPSGEPILGISTVPRTSALPRAIDLALISLPPGAVIQAVSELAALGTRAAVILTSGFGEVDERGLAEQAALLEAARASGLRLIGPNCMGVYSRPARLNGTYFWELPDAPGKIGVVSQSGAYGGLILRHLGAQGLGVSRFLSIGNQSDLEIADALDYLAEDDETELVACFVEAVRGGRRFVEAAGRVTASKVMVVLKAGRSDAGRRAAGSHTGSLTGATEAYQAAFRRAGVHVAGDTEELFDSIQALASRQPIPAAPTVCVVTVSGGPAVVAADAAESAGIALPETSPDTQVALRRLLPGFAAVKNPVDLTPQVNPEVIERAASLAMSDEAIAGALAIDVGLDIPAFAEGIVAASRSAGKCVIACVVDAATVQARFRAAGVPVYPTPERAVRAFRTLARRPRRWTSAARARSRPALRPDLLAALTTGRGPLGYEAARDILSAYGIRFCREHAARDSAEVVAAADSLGYPVAIKSARPGLLHKTEASAVALDVRGPAEAQAAAARMERAALGPFTVQEQITGGVELIVGGRRDPTFGPLAVVGTGGFYAELFRDASAALAPVCLDEARELVVEGRRSRLLGGYRGLPPADHAAVANAMVAVGDLLDDHARIIEVDVNPLIVRGAEAVAVDAVIILSGE